jgi:hypothetical protein
LVDFCDKYAQWSIQHPVSAAAGQLVRSNKTKELTMSTLTTRDFLLQLRRNLGRPSYLLLLPRMQQQSDLVGLLVLLVLGQDLDQDLEHHPVHQ